MLLELLVEDTANALFTWAEEAGLVDEDDEAEDEALLEPPDDPELPDPKTTTLADWPLGTVTTQNAAPPAPLVSLPEH